MTLRKIKVKTSVAQSIAVIANFIESKGMLHTAEKFSDNVYDFFKKLAENNRSYPICRDPLRADISYKCINYKKKYTIVFIESDA